MSWTAGDWFRLLREWDSFFDALEGWPGSYSHEREDGTFGADVMLQWMLDAPLLPLSWSVQLHKFVSIDPNEPFHSHQADWGVRVILFGEYTEERLRPSGKITRHTLRKGCVGIIRHSLSHRIVSIGPRGAVTLWLRGPTRHTVTQLFSSGFVRMIDAEGEAKEFYK